MPPLLLCSCEEVPTMMRRAHIVGGYRPTQQSRLYYLKSAFQLHNEVVNFWTHALPLVAIQLFYVLPELCGHQRWPLLVLHFGIACMLAASALTHLMHSRSARDHIAWLLVDFSGIAIFALAVGVQRWSCRSGQQQLNNPASTVTIPSADAAETLTTWLYLGSLTLVVLTYYISTCGLFLWRPHWKARNAIRLASCLLLALWMYIPIAGRYFQQLAPITTSVYDISQWATSWSYPYPTDLWPNDNGYPPPAVDIEGIYGANAVDDPTLHIHSRAFGWLLLSGVLMAANVPERLWPGRFDIFGYGHQLFHVCIAMVTWHVVEAGHIDCPLPSLLPTPMTGSISGAGGGSGFNAFTTQSIMMTTCSQRQLMIGACHFNATTSSSSISSLHL